MDIAYTPLSRGHTHLIVNLYYKYKQLYHSEPKDLKDLVTGCLRDIEEGYRNTLQQLYLEQKNKKR